MACISAPHVGLPDLFITLPTIALPPIPLPGLNLCCTLQLPPIPTYLVNAIIALAMSLIPGLGKVMQPVLAALMKAIDFMNSILDQITFSCPLN